MKELEIVRSSTGISECGACCAAEPWILNDTVKEYINMSRKNNSADVDEDLYECIINCCTFDLI